MTTTTENTQAKKKGLGFKITMLGIVPVLLMATLNLGVSYKNGLLFHDTMTTLEEKAKNADKLGNASAAVNKSLVKVRDDFAALGNFHQKSILQRNQMAVHKTRELRGNMTNVFTVLQQDVANLAKTLNSASMLETKGKASVQETKRLHYLIRTANNLPRLYELYVEANERSLKFLGNRRADSAANNFIYEEASRQAVLQKTLDHSAAILAELLHEVQANAMKKRTEFEADVLNQLDSTKYITIIIVAVVCVVLVIFTIGFASRKISNPLTNMVDAMGRLSQGDLEVQIPEGQQDEIGDMADALDVFKQNLIDTKRMSEDREKERVRVAAEQKAQRNELADDFESQVGEVVNSVASSSSQLQSTAKDMSEIASRNQERAGNATQAATNATTNVHTVASAAEELSNSINEIARQVAESSTMASQAANQATHTNETMRELADAAAKIGEVINLITDIAEQTNLLALNATIEAARAGEAGKGFAVVASEVKNLANQTAKATDEIAHQITTIQGTTENAVDAIDEVSKMIDNMNEVSSAIAAAVEEQGAATQEIASNVEQAAHSTQDASNDMDQVAQSAKRNGKAASDVLGAAEALSSQSDALRTQVNDFLSQIRAG
ncbi:HAMP domain-containing methyl-accepting chemotaxis protein [Terasakiella sp. SH-1]|uniref:methyl-accepting chemotaxis protein n=1 Tax=Terasakiella sp. SH-1 TaxID=2560057 RepID=UPI00142FED0F|nr:HAMP domain-containing methyl-accepting chemotaxis protein [Terasakiella sp. SH-1]